MEYAVLDAKRTGERIKELRKKCHLTVEQVSRHMGFESVQAIYKWQRGESLPTIDNLYALSKLLHTPVDDILRGSCEEEDSCGEIRDRFTASLINPLTYQKTCLLTP